MEDDDTIDVEELRENLQALKDFLAVLVLSGEVTSEYEAGFVNGMITAEHVLSGRTGDATLVDVPHTEEDDEVEFELGYMPAEDPEKYKLN